MIGVYVRGFVQKELGEAEARYRSGLSEDEWRVSVAPYIQKHVIESSDYPTLAQFFLHAEEWDDDKRFTFGLTCLLDGVVTQVLSPKSCKHAGKNKISEAQQNGMKCAKLT